MQEWQAELGLGSGSDSVWVGLITQLKGFPTRSSLLKCCLQLLFLQLLPLIPSDETVKGRVDLWSRLLSCQKVMGTFPHIPQFLLQIRRK